MSNQPIHPKIRVSGDPVLHQPAPACDDRALLQRVAAEMIPLLVEELNGAGLAAPQIGYAVPVIIFQSKPVPLDPTRPTIPLTVMYNPKIITASTETCLHWEACFSVPGYVGQVERPTRITVEYQDQNFNKITADFDGFAARVVQHEYDHLLGKLWTDYNIKPTDMMSLTDYMAMRQKEMEVKQS